MRRLRGAGRLVVIGLLSAAVLSLTGCVADPPPQIGVVVAGNGKVTVSWQPPPDTGASLAGYVVAGYVDGDMQASVSVSFGSSATTGTISGLTNGTTYRFDVVAVSDIGNESARSQQSDPVTPAVGAAVVVSGGSLHTCAALSSGTVECWGANGHGELGNGTTTNSATPVPVGGITDAAAVGAGDEHSCALLTGGTVRCWGSNLWGQLGTGSVGGRSLVPVGVPGVERAVGLSVGGDHTCVIEAVGGVKCWGYNGRGQLGIGTITPDGIPNPTVVQGIDDAVALAATSNFTCAELSGGGISCWGANDAGQLGNGTTTASATPVSVVGLTDATSVTTGVNGHTCALVQGGAIMCWGANGMGQLGNGTASESLQLAPAPVSGITGAISVDAGGSGTCAAITGGSVKCWGWNQYGQLGNGTTTQSSLPVTVTGLTAATAVTASHQHTCALTTSGAVRCWGYNLYGQLGNGTTTLSTTPVPVVEL
jgi:alpha-tubulin suppressor-like RCC1 family protein